MSKVDWDSGHCYCQCELCEIDDETQLTRSEVVGKDCVQELYCVPQLINDLGGHVVACECPDHCRGEEYVDYIKSFVSLVEEQDEHTKQWYRLDLLKPWIKKQEHIAQVNKLIKS